MRRIADRYINDPMGTVDRAAPSGAWSILALILLLFAVAAGWANVARVEQMTTGNGRFIPSSQTQLVESLEPGIIADIMVLEGDFVSKGQPLIKIDDTSSKSRLGELRQKNAALEAELSRLEAQTEGANIFEIPEIEDETVRRYYLSQQAVFAADQDELAAQRQIRKSQIRQREQRLRETETSIQQKVESLEFAERELNLSRNLYERKAIPEIEFLRIQRDVSDLRGDVALLRETRERLMAEIEEASRLMEADRKKLMAEAYDRISKINAELAVVNEALSEAQFRVGRTFLRSPADGIVNKLNVSSIGEVIQGGFSVVEIVPIDDQLLIEARISPQDIAFIRPGLDAKIRLSAYDYTKYGTLTGEVVRIGADTIANEDDESFYKVIVRTQDRGREDGIRIIPGMVATVSISTGNRTVMEYLAKPILKIRDFAFRDPR